MTLAEDALLTVVKVPDYPPSLTVIFENNHTEHTGDIKEDLEDDDDDNYTMAAEDRFTIWCESGISSPVSNLSIFWNNKRLMRNEVLSYRVEEITVAGLYQYFCNLPSLYSLFYI